MEKKVKAIRIGDKLMLFIDGKKQTVSRKIAPEAFDEAVKYIKEENHDKLRSMFSNVNEKITEYAKGIFKIVGNNVYAKGEEHTPAPKLVARKLFEMMQLKENPQPLRLLNKKMHRNGNGVVAGMDIFSKMNDIPMTTKGNLVLKVGMDKEQLIDILQTHGTVVGSPLRSNQIYGGNIQHDLPVVGFEFEEKENYVYCLVDPSDIVAYFNGNIRVSRYRLLKKYKREVKPVVNVPFEELYDVSFDIWDERNSNKSNKAKKGKVVNEIQ